MNRKRFYAHRVAWLLHYGEWPDDEIDHINGVKDDNRISNLRNVDRKTNVENRRAVRGYHKSVGGYTSYLKHHGRQLYLGYFKTAEEARAAYLKAKRKLHKGCTI